MVIRGLKVTRDLIPSDLRPRTSADILRGWLYSRGGGWRGLSSSKNVETPFLIPFATPLIVPEAILLRRLGSDLG